MPVPVRLRLLGADADPDRHLRLSAGVRGGVRAHAGHARLRRGVLLRGAGRLPGHDRRVRLRLVRVPRVARHRRCRPYAPHAVGHITAAKLLLCARPGGRRLRCTAAAAASRPSESADAGLAWPIWSASRWMLRLVCAGRSSRPGCCCWSPPARAAQRWASRCCWRRIAAPGDDGERCWRSTRWCR